MQGVESCRKRIFGGFYHVVGLGQMDVFRFYTDTHFEPDYENPLRTAIRESFTYLHEFTVGEAVSNITCPSLALVGTGEGGEPEKQYQEFCASVSGPVASYTFTDFEGAGTHCQVGNPAFAAAVTLDWLDELFD